MDHDNWKFKLFNEEVRKENLNIFTYLMTLG